MLARGLVGRLTADVTRTPTHDLAQLSRLVQRVSLSHTAGSQALQCLSNHALQYGLHLTRRNYGNAVSKTTTTRATTTRSAGTQTAAAPAKKPGRPKKGASSTKAAPKTKGGRPPKKATPKKKPVRKKAAAKPKAKPVRKRKVLTEKQKETRTAQKERDRIKELKAKALSEPKKQPATAWTILSAELVKENHGVSGAKSASEKYKNLTPEEREHYNQLANQAKEANEAAYKAWVESHTAEEIRIANNARMQLRHLAKKKNPKSRAISPQRIRDHRQVKRPLYPYTMFSAERHRSGDLKGLSLTEAAKLVKREWDALSESEKQKYHDQHEQDRQRYIREYKDIYGHEPYSVKHPRSSSSASASS